MPTPQQIDAALAEAIDKLGEQIKEARQHAVSVIIDALTDYDASDAADVGDYTVCARFQGVDLAIKVELA
jgi:hypothetical protein